MPSDIRFEEFRRLFERHGVEFIPGGKHWKMRMNTRAGVISFPLATLGGRYVKYGYLKKARMAFSLMPDDGIRDEDFFA